MSQKVQITLKKPYTLWREDVGEFIQDKLYCRTGTVLKFDDTFWLMSSSYVTEHLEELIDVEFDIPGKKSHSIHTTGVFKASVHNISNLAYHANID